MTQDKDQHAECNIIQGQQLRANLAQAMKDIADLLGHFCGPYAEYAASPKFGIELVPTEYTHDGITILKYMQFRSPETQFCRNLIGYVGSQVDRICNDGTTTGMLFGALLSSSFLTETVGKTRTEMRKLTAHMAATVQTLSSQMEQNRLTVEGLYAEYSASCVAGRKKKPLSYEKFRERIVYWAAMTSTKGDVEISTALTEAALSYPKEFYDHRRVGSMSVERKERVVIFTQESNFEVEATVADFAVKGNRALGDIHEYEKSYLTVSTENLADGKFTADVLTNVVQNVASGKQTLGRPWFVIAPEIASATLFASVQSYNRTERGAVCPIVLCNFYYGEPLLNATMAKAIAACAGDGHYAPIDDCMRRQLTFDDFVIPCSIKLGGGRLEIGDLYTKIEGPYHPFYHDPKQTVYHTLLKDIDERLAMNGQKKAGVADTVVTKLLYIKRCILTQNLKDIMVAGTAHDGEANKSVVTDALGTVIDTLSDGFVLSGFVAMRDYARAGLTDVDPLIRECFISTFETILSKTYDRELTASSFSSVKGEPKHRYYAARDGAVKTGNIIDDLKKARLDHSAQFPIIQPYRGFQAQLMRVGEIIPKLGRLHALMLNAQ